MFFLVGYLHNDNNIEIISDGKRYFALYGWNGLQYCDCWEVSDEDGFDPIDGDTKYYFGPIYLEKEEDEYELIGYEENKESYIMPLDDLVEYWHTHETGKELKEFLHLTDEEYQKYILQEFE